MKKNKKKRLTNRWVKVVPILIALSGAGLIAVALLADLIGVGGQAGLGVKQILLMVAGIIAFLGGLFLVTPPGQKFLGALLIGKTQPASFLMIAAWFGLLIGWTETFVWVFRKYALGEFNGMEINFLWTVPLANLFLFILLGLILSLVTWRWPGFISLRTGILVLAFVGILSLIYLLFPGLHDFAALLLAAGLAVQVARLVARRPKGFHRLVSITVALPVTLAKFILKKDPQGSNETENTDLQLSRREFLLGAGASVAAMAIGTRGWQMLDELRTLSQLPPAPQRMPNVLLIVLDTVRAKSLSLHGYHRQTSPQLERLASRGVFFERAVASAPWTLPSHASMFTGHYPHRLSAGWFAALDAAYPTLAEAFSAHGYLTAGFVANLSFCTREFGLDRGFTHYEDSFISPGLFVLRSSLGRTITEKNGLSQHYLHRKTAEHVNRDFLGWLSGNTGERPFFAFLNYFDAHDPYVAPDDFTLKFTSRIPRYLRHDFYGERPSPSQIKELNDAYDGCIAYLDHHIGLLVDELETRGLLENTLVIITSDHGEQFGEHGFTNHGNSLYMPLLHVPLLISFPAKIPAGLRVRDPVTLRDLAATVVDLTDLYRDKEFPGRSLRRHWVTSAVTAKPAPEMQLAEIEQLNLPARYPIATGAMKSLVCGNMHYIRHEVEGYEELYDWVNDPQEENDLAGFGDSQSLIDKFRTSMDTILGVG